jgi:hypothetical protein
MQVIVLGSGPDAWGDSLPVRWCSHSWCNRRHIAFSRFYGISSVLHAQALRAADRRLSAQTHGFDCGTLSPTRLRGISDPLAPRRSASPSDPRPRPRPKPKPRKLSLHPLALSPSSWASRRRVTCLSFPSRCHPESLDRKACSDLGAHRLSASPASSSPPDFITSDKQTRKASLNTTHELSRTYMVASYRVRA